ncbi:hypothetical protein BGZ70_007095 [Mortierella alpina]|uniref:Uncharacterized protein n=1 Tax=Mortierella alpina TaxID=64518 RepID=A0A9P6J714_MORAP|nr:hypothetical protein BGZ70_007095 [Mortierella alpina]
MDKVNRHRGFLTLCEQVDHPAWRLKHLDIGYGNPSDVAKILRVSAPPLVSFQLWSTIEAVLSQCPDLKSFDVYTYERGLDRRTVMIGGTGSQWVGSDGRVFKVLLSDKALWAPVLVLCEAMGENKVKDEENSIPDDPWKQLELMESFKIESHIRFLAI